MRDLQRPAGDQELAVFRWIGAQLSRSTRRYVVAIFVLRVLARLGGLGASMLFLADRSATSLAVALAIASAALVLLKRLFSTNARVDAEGELHIAVSRALLDADVVEPLMVEPHFALSEGIHTASDLVANGFPGLAAESVAAIFAFGALAISLSTKAFLMVGLGSLIAALAMLLLRGRIGKLHADAVAAQEKLSTAFAITLHGRLEWVASNTESVALQRVRDAASIYREQGRRTAAGAAVLGRAPIAIAVFVGAIALVLETASEPDWFAATFAAVRRLLVLGAALPILLGVAFGIPEMVRARKRLEPFARVVLRSPRNNGPAATQKQRKPPKVIELDAVDFSYGDDFGRVLNKLSVKWRSGVLLLAGPNRSGKSTALRLILGLRQPTGGTIRIDDVSLDAMDLATLRSHIVFVPQQPYLGEPYTTIEDALRLFDPTITREAMRSALERVGLGVMTSSPTELLERPIGELSVGQRQRLVLARALLRTNDATSGSSVVLFDEPDANLDADATRRLVELVFDLGREHLVAIAAHGQIVDHLTNAGGPVNVEVVQLGSKMPS